MAGLTVLRAYHVAGRPAQKIRPFGRFEQWSDWVRSALVWLGEVDPCETRKLIDDADPERAGLKAVLAGWWKLFKSRPVTVAEVMDEINGDDKSPLLAALKDVASERSGAVTGKGLGYYLRRVRGRIVGNKKIEKAGTDRHSKTALWRIEKV